MTAKTPIIDQKAFQPKIRYSPEARQYTRRNLRANDICILMTKLVGIISTHDVNDTGSKKDDSRQEVRKTVYEETIHAGIHTYTHAHTAINNITRYNNNSTEAPHEFQLQEALR